MNETVARTSFAVVMPFSTHVDVQAAISASMSATRCPGVAHLRPENRARQQMQKQNFSNGWFKSMSSCDAPRICLELVHAKLIAEPLEWRAPEGYHSGRTVACAHDIEDGME